MYVFVDAHALAQSIRADGEIASLNRSVCQLRSRNREKNNPKKKKKKKHARQEKNEQKRRAILEQAKSSVANCSSMLAVCRLTQHRAPCCYKCAARFEKSAFRTCSLYLFNVARKRFQHAQCKTERDTSKYIRRCRLQSVLTNVGYPSPTDLPVTHIIVSILAFESLIEIAKSNANETVKHTATYSFKSFVCFAASESTNETSTTQVDPNNGAVFAVDLLAAMRDEGPLRDEQSSAQPTTTTTTHSTRRKSKRKATTSPWTDRCERAARRWPARTAAPSPAAPHPSSAEDVGWIDMHEVQDDEKSS